MIVGETWELCNRRVGRLIFLALGLYLGYFDTLIFIKNLSLFGKLFFTILTIIFLGLAMMPSIRIEWTPKKVTRRHFYWWINEKWV